VGDFPHHDHSMVITLEGAGGQASIFAADHIDTWSDDALVDEFRRSRQKAYEDLGRDAAQLLRQVSGTSKRAAARRPPRRGIQQLRDRLAAIERIDFFASAGRDNVLMLLRGIDERRPGHHEAKPPAGERSYKQRLWVTRPRPGVDRMASAWLIRRFVDPAARFDFVADRDNAARETIPFDMFGVEFTHRGEHCTFEMLADRFALQDPALARLGAIVHDLDLKDDKFAAAEAAATGLVIEGLRL
jgi:hypothetical protein